MGVVCGLAMRALPHLTKIIYLSVFDKWTNFVNSSSMTETKKSKILAAARAVFLRYGFKRVNMNDIAAGAGISRPALYLLFKNKEEIFVGVFRQWVDETVKEIETSMASIEDPMEKLKCAFEIWAVRPFGMVIHSPEAKELIDCGFDFAQDAMWQGYLRFEAAIVPALAALAGRHSAKALVAPETAAHVLASAVRGFKQTAATPEELRQLIEELLAFASPVSNS